MNRKGVGYGEPIVDYIVMLVIILIIIAFFALYKLTDLSVEGEIESHILTLDSTIILNNYLETETKLDDKKMTIADLFNRLTEHDIKTGFGPIMNKINEETRKFIVSYHTATGCPIVVTLNLDNNIHEIDTGLKPVDPCKVQPVFDSRQLLPNMEGWDIMVSLY